MEADSLDLLISATRIHPCIGTKSNLRWTICVPFMIPVIRNLETIIPDHQERMEKPFEVIEAPGQAAE